MEEALPPFTSTVADLLRLFRKGRVETGLDADLVVLGDLGGVQDVWPVAAGMFGMGSLRCLEPTKTDNRISPNR